VSAPPTRPPAGPATCPRRWRGPFLPTELRPREWLRVGPARVGGRCDGILLPRRPAVCKGFLEAMPQELRSALPFSCLDFTRLTWIM